MLPRGGRGVRSGRLLSCPPPTHTKLTKGQPWAKTRYGSAPGSTSAVWFRQYIYIYTWVCFGPIGVFLTLGAAAPGDLRPGWPWLGFCPIGVFLPLGAAAPGDLRGDGPGCVSDPPPQRLHPGGVTYGTSIYQMVAASPAKPDAGPKAHHGATPLWGRKSRPKKGTTLNVLGLFYSPGGASSAAHSGSGY